MTYTWRCLFINVLTLNNDYKHRCWQWHDLDPSSFNSKLAHIWYISILPPPPGWGQRPHFLSQISNLLRQNTIKPKIVFHCRRHFFLIKEYHDFHICLSPKCNVNAYWKMIHLRISFNILNVDMDVILDAEVYKMVLG